MKQASGSGLIEVLVVLAVLSMLLVAGVLIIQMPDKKPVENQTTEVEAQSEHNVTDTTNTDDSFKIDYGVSLSPLSFNGSDFTSFFDQAESSGTAITWAGESSELNDPTSAPYVLFEQARARSLLPIIITDHKNKEAIIEFANKYKPAYVGIGNEVNLLPLAEQQNLIAAYPGLVGEIKIVSPNTVVFPVFQLERMKGLGGGLYGGQNTPDQHTWRLLESFPKAKAFGFTTYPGMIYPNPADIPGDYYSDLSTQTEKPVLFTEVGWQSRSVGTGWESTPDEQATFATSFFELVEELHPRLVIWSFLYDQKVDSPFDSMGLIGRDGKEKPAFEAWKEKVGDGI